MIHGRKEEVSAMDDHHHPLGEQQVWLAPCHLCDVAITLLPPKEENEREEEEEEEEEEEIVGVKRKREKEGNNVVVLHSPSSSLSAIPFFACWLSDRWRAKPTRSDVASSTISLQTLTTPLHYARVIRWTCSIPPKSSFAFSNPNDALSILHTADHLLAHHCSTAAMNYLSAVPLSMEEEEMLRSVFMNGHTGVPSPDLAARLGLNEKPTKAIARTVEKFVVKLMGEHKAPWDSVRLTDPSEKACAMIIRDSLSKEAPIAAREAVLEALLLLWNQKTNELKESWKKSSSSSSSSSQSNKALIETAQVNPWLWLTDRMLEWTHSATVADIFVTDYKFLFEIISLSTLSSPAIYLAKRKNFPQFKCWIFLKAFEKVTSLLAQGEVVLLSTQQRREWIEEWLGFLKRKVSLEQSELKGAIQDNLNEFIKTLPLEEQGDILIRYLQDSEEWPSLQGAYKWWRQKIWLHAGSPDPSPNSV